MPGLKKRLTHTLVSAENQLDLIKYRLRERLGGRRPLMILPYNGCGRPDRLYLKGRVLEDKGIQPAREGDDLLDNLLNTYKRALSAEIPYARLRARFQGVEQEVVADEEGFFEVWITPATPLSSASLWQDVDLELLEPRRSGEEPAHAVGRVFIAPAGASFGVISDVDDTVVQTGGDAPLRVLNSILLSNASTRLPFDGVSAFYRALYQGPTGDQCNPLFFVSGSPWNLYDLFVDFFNLHGIPGGPLLFLRDWGFSENGILPTHNLRHKTGLCKLIFDLYPALPFILIGDSAQEDPEVYHELVDRYPGRIKAVYIRSVSRRLRRVQAIRKLRDKIARDGSQLILAEDTQPLVAHARSQGWIREITVDQG
jgi:phosphatidate phosphatase APP1